MIKVMSYELNNNQIECLYDRIDWLWYIVYQGRTTCFSSFEQASEAMDEAIRELNNLDN